MQAWTVHFCNCHLSFLKYFCLFYFSLQNSTISQPINNNGWNVKSYIYYHIMPKKAPCAYFLRFILLAFDPCEVNNSVLILLSWKITFTVKNLKYSGPILLQTGFHLTVTALLQYCSNRSIENGSSSFLWDGIWGSNILREIFSHLPNRHAPVL